MSEVEKRLSAEGLVLPFAPAPAGAYVPAVLSGSLVFTSGQLPLFDGSLLAMGIVGKTVTLEVARQCARQCALNALAAAATVCRLDDVSRVVKLSGYVTSAPDFFSQPAVIDAASEVMAIAFGDRGRHAREAVGVAALPLGSPVELATVIQVS
jgi:enamine deaminase RidA (YjgF/YER057c/UK114 family)